MLNIHNRVSLVVGPSGNQSFRINNTFTFQFANSKIKPSHVKELIIKTYAHDDEQITQYLQNYPKISTIHFDNCKTATKFKPPDGKKVCIKLRHMFNLECDGADDSELRLHEGVEEIDFYYLPNLKKLNLPNSLKTIKLRNMFNLKFYGAGDSELHLHEGLEKIDF